MKRLREQPQPKNNPSTMKIILLCIAAASLSSCALVPSFFESSEALKYRGQFYGGEINYQDLRLLEKADRQMNPTRVCSDVPVNFNHIDIMRKGICKHWIGHGSPTHCAAGVCYQDVTHDPEAIGSAFRVPCRLPDSWSQPRLRDMASESTQGTCDKREFPTDVECAESERKMDEFMRRVTLVDPVIGALKKKYQGKGFQGTIECPACKGVMHVRIAGCNGHAKVNRETEDCVRFIE